MKTTRAAVAVIALAIVTVVGCQPAASPTTPPREKETNVHVDAPGVKVDVKGKGGDKDHKVDVDVNRKDR